MRTLGLAVLCVCLSVDELSAQGRKARLTDPSSGKTIVAGALVDSPPDQPEAPADFPTGVFTNPAPITINDAGPSTPYPSDIVVAGVAWTPSRIAVTLNGLGHTFPADIDILLEGPTGVHSLVISGVGGATDVTNLTLTLDPAAPSAVPAILTSGTFQPTNIGGGDVFAPPAPAGPYSVNFGAFAGVDPNGTWSLFVMDNAALDTGNITGGWALTLFGPFDQSVTLVSESCAPANGVVDPGETVTASVCVENTGGSASGSIEGTLQATGGVENPSGPELYGVIGAGQTVCRNFTFNLDLGATCGAPFTLTMDYTEDGAPLGSESTVLPTGELELPVIFSNPGAITIPGVGTSGPAVPYPSSILVAGVVGPVGKVTVTITNYNHTFPDDVDVLLVGPTGARILLISDAGGSADNVNVTYAFDQAAATALADAALNPSGTYRPTNYGTGDTFPAPAPAAPYGSSLDDFNGLDPNGTWSLYVVDDVGGDVGNFNGGWSVAIQTLSCCTQACTVTPPPNQTVPNDPGLCTAVVDYPPPTIEGICGAVLCAPPPGSIFPVGNNTVTCTPEVGTPAPFAVTVDDVELPVLTCPADIVEDLPVGVPSGPVTWSDPLVADNCPNPGAPTCVPPSGSIFPGGQTTPVNCSALDASGNAGTCSFNVTLGLLSILEIPAASRLGLALLALLLAGAAFFVLRRNA